MSAWLDIAIIAGQWGIPTIAVIISGVALYRSSLARAKLIAARPRRATLISTSNRGCFAVVATFVMNEGARVAYVDHTWAEIGTATRVECGWCYREVGVDVDVHDLIELLQEPQYVSPIALPPQSAVSLVRAYHFQGLETFPTGQWTLSIGSTMANGKSAPFCSLPVQVHTPLASDSWAEAIATSAQSPLVIE